jgi:Domain of unknown function (DUF4082)/PEP-CTERM motif
MRRTACFVLAMGLVPLAATATPLTDITGGAPLVLSGSAFVVGYEFHLSDTFGVDALGLWDEGSDGLSGGHQVGLWTASGTLLASGVVDNSGTAVASASSDGRWLFDSIAPLTLSAGDYVVAALFGADSLDAVRVSPASGPIVNATFAPGSAFDEARVLASATLTFPANTVNATNEPRYFGPNVALTAVPEPSTTVLFGAGLVVFGLGRVVRRQSPLH